jgi:hypothetical protein
MEPAASVFKAQVRKMEEANYPERLVHIYETM